MTSRKVTLSDTAMAELKAWRLAVSALEGAQTARTRGDAADYDGACDRLRVAQARVAPLLADACARAFLAKEKRPGAVALSVRSPLDYARMVGAHAGWDEATMQKVARGDIEPALPPETEPRPHRGGERSER